MGTKTMMDIDDEQSFAKKPKPIGWFVAGAVTIGSLTLALSHYLPLKSAHQTLVSQHDQLAQKSAELDHALKTDRTALAATDARKKTLERFIAAGAQAETELSTALEVASATAQNQLAPFIKAKLVQHSVEGGGLTLTFADKLMFRGPTSALAPQAGATLCKAVTPLVTEKDWVVRPLTASAPGDKKYWETASERAAALAQVLEAKCKIARDRIHTEVRGSTAADGEPSVGTQLILGPATRPEFLASQAPSETGTDAQTPPAAGDIDTKAQE